MEVGVGVAATVALVACLTLCVSANLCSWEIIDHNKRYSFDLGAAFKGYAHGALSEDGFYRVFEKDPTNGGKMTYWFQLCEHMKFNHDPPLCQRCESCGGPEHCGETCSALQAVSYAGYSVCTTLGSPSNTIFSAIDSQKPEIGVLMNTTTINSPGNCSLSISVFCKRDGEKLPSSVTKEPYGACNYRTTIKHPVGCPVVTPIKNGGLGWFITFLIVLICLFVIYMVVGVAYRISMLGVRGVEAIPNLTFWHTLPSRIQTSLENLVSTLTSYYRQMTEPSYVRVLE